MVLTNGAESIDFGSDGFEIIKFEISPYKIDTAVSQGEKLSGAISDEFEIGESDILIEGYIKGENIDLKRRKLGRITSPVSEFLLIDGKYKLSLRLSYGIGYSSEKRFSEKVLKFKIIAKAPYPFWQSSDETVLQFDGCATGSTDDTAIRLTNDGDLDTGCIIEAKIFLSTSEVWLRVGDKYIYTNYPFSVGDVLRIDTRFGKKKVEVLPKGSTEYVSIINKLSSSSKFFYLSPGENRIDYFFRESLANITVSFTPFYMR